MIGRNFFIEDIHMDYSKALYKWYKNFRSVKGQKFFFNDHSRLSVCRIEFNGEMYTLVANSTTHPVQFQNEGVEDTLYMNSKVVAFIDPVNIINEKTEISFYESTTSFGYSLSPELRISSNVKPTFNNIKLDSDYLSDDPDYLHMFNIPDHHLNQFKGRAEDVIIEYHDYVDSSIGGNTIHQAKVSDGKLYCSEPIFAILCLARLEESYKRSANNDYKYALRDTQEDIKLQLTKLLEGLDLEKSKVVLNTLNELVEKKNDL